LVLLSAGFVGAHGGQGIPATPYAVWAQPPDLGVTFCVGGGVQVGALLGPGCVLSCITDGACATFVRDAQLLPVHFRVTYLAWNHTVVEGADNGGLFCTFIGDMWDGRITVFPDASAGPAGLMNTQEDEGQFCYGP
ncbi:MAG: hypothetical protein LC624_11945, partial [Halobacteriales archaeon]|nr:hypothetical protein [Halobacteriales archaeon]